MGHKWIIDVLADLQSFAQANDLVLLAEQLEQTADVAMAELSSKSAGVPFSAVCNDDEQVGQVYQKARESKCA